MKSKSTFSTFLVISFVAMFSITVQGAFYNTAEQITSPYWDALLDAAGYGDEFYWGNSPYHPHTRHELLSGEWAAAIYYDGIASDPDAMWLTDEFIFPYWDTENDFLIQSDIEVWNDSNNPVNGSDTGHSVISNNEVEITIDYEIADLGETQFSPLAYREPNETVSVKRSERYVLLQTYTIKNIKASGNVTGLEFYQMLHGHGADEYGPAVHCTYETLDYPDALENYIPYNAVHTVGNFKYDITQWNNLDDPTAQTAKKHVDWVGFSSAIEPNVIECGYYEGNLGKPATGTHISVEERNLDGNDFSYGETAGATGWYLPTLAPGESTSITVAFMFGTLNWPIPTILTKVNADPNNECVDPCENNYLAFDICYDANGYALDDAILTDHLPDEVDYNSSEPNGTYDSNDHTVTWDLNDIGANDSNCFEVITTINYYARPGGMITNYVVLDSEHIYYTQASYDVNVCAYGSEIIYVDKDANGFNNGTSWDDAYTDLQDAFTGAQNLDADIIAIWVAKPVWDVNEDNYKNISFEMVENVGLFGHFDGTESHPDQRDFADANNETILEGQIGFLEVEAVCHVVEAEGIEDANTIIDGYLS
jgi:hypothetical protein